MKEEGGFARVESLESRVGESENLEDKLHMPTGDGTLSLHPGSAPHRRLATPPITLSTPRPAGFGVWVGGVSGLGYHFCWYPCGQVK